MILSMIVPFAYGAGAWGPHGKELESKDGYQVLERKDKQEPWDDLESMTKNWNPYRFLTSSKPSVLKIRLLTEDSTHLHDSKCTPDPGAGETGEGNSLITGDCKPDYWLTNKMSHRSVTRRAKFNGTWTYAHLLNVEMVCRYFSWS